MKISNAIHHDRSTGAVTNATPIERLGILLMSMGSAISKPIGHVGFSLGARVVRKVLRSNKMIVAQEFDDTKFAYPYGDLYWSRLSYTKDRYSADMENFLYAIRDVDYVFLDCGANYGFFSALITSKRFGQKPSIAIEADPNTYKFLQTNCELNDHRFDIRHNAIYSSSGETVNIFGEKHEARSILPDGNQDSSHGNVETLAVSDLKDWVESKNAKACMLKLDVEGVEIDAVKGAGAMLEKDSIIYYEDHGSEKNHEITRYMMEELGLTVFWPDFDGKCHLIENIDQLTKIKRNSRNGYDFVATKSEMWLAEIQKLVN